MHSIGKIYVTIDKVLEEEIVTEGGIKFYIAAEYSPEWYCTCVGRVAVLPSNPTGEYANIPKDLKVGDEVIFSYAVISEQDVIDGTDYFMEITDSPYIRKWINGKGERLSVIGMPAVHGFSKIWVGLVTNRQNERVDGWQGTESEIERWLAQFPIANHKKMRYKNLVEYNGVNYWKADYQDIFAKREKGHLIALGDRVIMQPVETEIKKRIELISGEILPYQNIQARYMDRGRVLSGGKSDGIKKDEIVSFEEGFLEKYDLYGKKYYLIKTKRINGKWQETSTKFMIK